MLVLVPTAFEARWLFEAETHAALSTRGFARTTIEGVPVSVALCGFGLAAAGAGAAHAICREAAEADCARTHGSLDRTGGARTSAGTSGAGGDCRVILAGIAGTYDPARAPVGSAFAATGARCIGIGAGQGRWHRSAAALGWNQGLGLDGLPPAGDDVAFEVPPRAGPPGADALLLSVAAASGSRRAAAARAAAHPGALAEEMEAFAVGLAARLARRRLTVLRGISNVAGDRRTPRWQTAEALAAVRTLLVQTLHAPTTNSPKTPKVIAP